MHRASRAKNETLTEAETIVMTGYETKSPPERLIVRPNGGDRARGTVQIGDIIAPCAFGPAGIVSDKREGDGATPAGVFPLRWVYFRPDRIAAPKTGLELKPIGPDDGWCDDPSRAEYNRPVTLPYEGSHERLAREDHVYDICVVLGHNDDPPVPGAGSAIFFHLAHADYRPTAGCIAVSEADMRAILAPCRPGAEMDIAA